MVPPCISGRRTAPWSLGAIHLVAVIHPQSQAGASLTESGSGQVHRYFVHNYGNLTQCCSRIRKRVFQLCSTYGAFAATKAAPGQTIRKFMQMVIFIKIEDCSAWIRERGINKEKRREMKRFKQGCRERDRNRDSGEARFSP